MEKIAIMTDTNSGIIPKEAKELGIALLQMPFFVDGEEFFEYGSMEYGEFFERLSAGSEVSTSQPAPSALCSMWDKLLENNDIVIYIPMSSSLSGTCQTAKMLSAEYNGRVLVVDNKRISVTLRSSIIDALNMIKQGLNAEKIVENLEKNALNSSIYISVNTLTHLKKGGRITPSAAAIGSILGIKPVLQIQGEKLDAYKKVRGMPAAMEAMLDAIESDLETRFANKKIVLRAAYSGKYSQAELWLNTLKAKFKDYEIGIDALPVSICCHLGPDALGVGICETE